MAKANLAARRPSLPEPHVLDALGLPFARAAQTSSTGFALVDRAGRTRWTTAAFSRLVRLRGASAGVELAEHLRASFRLAEDEAGAALRGAGPATLELREGRDAAPVMLHLATLDPGEEVRVAVAVAADPSRSSAAGGPVDEALVDPLTRLGNRSLLERRLAEARDRDGDRDGDGDATRCPLALVMIDLDRFKPVNDTLGHAAGDKLLALVADRLKRACRAGDTVVRLGGDEFVILLHGVGENEPSVEGVASRAIELLGRAFLLDGQQVHIGASAGVASLDDATASVDDLLRHADLALYEAKRAGRGTWRRFAPAFEERARARRELEIALRRALPRRELELVYQPQVALPDNALTGFEALIRWNHPERGLVPPLDFIPLAEETGEIHAIGLWVLERACREATGWPDALGIAVNVSPVQFARDDFVARVATTLERTGLAPHRLEIELTEGVLIDDTERAREHLGALRALGVGIAMDDFGTGYSSLGYLSSFPFTKIKIDRSFVSGARDDRSRSLVSSILSIGQSLGMRTIAEGVETAEDLAALATGGCHAAQGYLISRPIDADAVAGFIDSHPIPAAARDEQATSETER